MLIKLKTHKNSILLAASFLLLCSLVNAQTSNKSNFPSYKNTIGIQFNPYLDNDFFTGDGTKYVYALRYAYNFKNGISAGPEISGFYESHSTSNFKFNYHVMQYGVFGRYCFYRKFWIQPFAELNGYYMIKNYDVKKNTTGLEAKSWDKNLFTFYGAPGVSVKIPKTHLSLDMMYKFSPEKFVNDEKNAFTFRINYSF